MRFPSTTRFLSIDHLYLSRDTKWDLHFIRLWDTLPNFPPPKSDEILFHEKFLLLFFILFHRKPVVDYFHEPIGRSLEYLFFSSRIYTHLHICVCWYKFMYVCIICTYIEKLKLSLEEWNKLYIYIYRDITYGYRDHCYNYII